MADHSQAQGKSRSSNVSARRTDQDSFAPSSQALSDQPSFTFIDHDDDLASKRIKDAKARKAIRSHVMRDVRRRERLAGLKRVSKRDDRSSSDVSSTSDVSQKQSRPKTPAREHSLPVRTSTPPDLNSTSSSASGQVAVHPRSRRRNSTWDPKEVLTALTNRITSSHSTMDPFCTLPGASQYPAITQNLVQYLLTVFIPMTFPTENKAARDNEKKLKVMVKSSFTDPGSFYGAMSMMAAHRAALTGRHSNLANVFESSTVVLYDPDYYIMKAHAMKEMNAKLRDPRKALGDEAFDTIINLLTGAMIVGLFDEARVHLKGLRRMVALRGDKSTDLDSHLTATIIAADLKASAGLMMKPVFPLWPLEPVPPELKTRIRPPPASPLHFLGLGFDENPFLSEALLATLDRYRDNLLLMHLSNQNSGGLAPDDNQTLWRLSNEVEHELLSYPHRTPGGLSMHPIESVARIAAEFSMNQIVIYSPPSTGLARALTRHLKGAVETCMAGGLSPLPVGCQELLAWALFTGAQGCLNQVEYPWFISRLANIFSVRGWTSWEEVQHVLRRYIFVSYLQDSSWRMVSEQAVAHAATAELETE